MLPCVLEATFLFKLIFVKTVLVWLWCRYDSLCMGLEKGHKNSICEISYYLNHFKDSCVVTSGVTCSLMWL